MLLLAAIALVVPATAAPFSFKSGDICKGVNMSLPADQLIRGRRLTVTEMVWEPFWFNDSDTNEMVGLDVDLLNLIAERLGITWEAVDVESFVADAWDIPYRELAVRGLEGGDVWAGCKCLKCAAYSLRSCAGLLGWRCPHAFRRHAFPFLVPSHTHTHTQSLQPGMWQSHSGVVWISRTPQATASRCTPPVL